MDDKTGNVIAARSAAHLPEDAVDRHVRENRLGRARQRTTRAVQQRQQRQAAAETQKRMNWVDRRIAQHHEQRNQRLEEELLPQSN
jgi:hypothetical protein